MQKSWSESSKNLDILSTAKGEATQFTKNSNGQRVTVPMHKGKDLKPGTLMGLLKDIGIDKQTFFDLL